MAQQISVEITINGKKITPFSQLSLRQQFNGHHSFELRFNHDVLEEKMAMTLDKSKSYLGKSISIAFNDFNKSKSDNIFKGIVTDISFSNNASSPGDLVFRGYSPSILLEGGETNLSHLKHSLSQIVKDTIGSIPSNDLSTKIIPVKTSPLPYVTQYRESNFAFIRRIAAEYGEWFFYDGNTLNFGKPSGGDTLTLQYPNDISDLNLQVKLSPVNFEETSYLSKDNKQVEGPSSSQQVAGLDTFGKLALSTSDQIFTAKSRTLSRRKFLENAELYDAVKIAKSTSAASMVVMHAQTDSPFIKLGGTIQVMADTTDYGKFTVISLNHQTDGLGNYQNEFEAIPSTVTVMPNPYFHKPVAEPQAAIVMENKDPDNLGKVQVKLLWQKDPATTPFIRVLTPDAGTYKDGKKTRGLFFTPEKGDYVVVGFAQNDPDRPFVMGSLPNGKSIDSAANDDNYIKSISTRGGSIIYFHDKDDEKEIRIQTDEANYVSILVKDSDGTVQVYSSKAIEVNSKETIVVKSGKSIDVQGDKTINVKSEKITVEASDTLTLKANNKIAIQSMAISIEGSNTVEVKGQASVKVEGAQVEMAGTGTAKVSGAQLSLEGIGMASLKAALVQIN